ncbi:MAG: SRPBCC family protein [Parasphingorhabdus sp.]|uniref:aromatic ring-hydroxylating oxygenase subunit alpha n=1 Tax=Parasphingorhabdus sp. TaxID=2709688 RepID=UPI003296B196
MKTEIMATTEISRFDDIHGSTELMSDESVIARLFDHIDNGTTDRGQSSWKEPTENYRSENRLDTELALFRRRWIVFCPSSALPKAGDYIARDAAGIPLIIVRGNDGDVRAFRNACRHRGVQVASGQGCTSIFVCPYHGWSYGTDGALRSAPHSDGFPGLEKETRGLVSVDCLEKAGLIFVRQGTDHDDNKDAPDLPDVVPKNFRVVKTETSEIQANWKLHLESALEGYHIRSTHQTTFFPVQYDNLTVVEAFGENSRIAFPYQAIEGLRDKPKSKWSANGRITFVYHLFPNIIISTFPDCIQVVVIEPLGLELTRQHMFLLTDCAEGGEALDAVFKGQEFAAKGAVEDRDIVMSAQRGLKSGANEFLEFGLFESAIGRFHKALTRELEIMGS